MARQLRIEFEEAFYHITSRGNLRDRIFFGDKDREKFLEILQRTKERYSYLLHAYTLMDNHYHLLIETPKANISRIMQNINTIYTVHINRKYRRSGHLFQGRFKGLVVDKDEYLVTVSRYIHLNPIRKIIDVDDIRSVINIPDTFGKKVEVVVLPLFNEQELMSEGMMKLQQESGFIKAIFESEKEDVWNNV